jgi:hypothetical protein
MARSTNVTTEEAQQAEDVVLGMFLASSHPATVLFDSAASHPLYHQHLLQSIIYPYQL